VPARVEVRDLCLAPFRLYLKSKISEPGFRQRPGAARVASRSETSFSAANNTSPCQCSSMSFGRVLAQFFQKPQQCQPLLF